MVWLVKARSMILFGRRKSKQAGKRLKGKCWGEGISLPLPPLAVIVIKAWSLDVVYWCLPCRIRKAVWSIGIFADAVGC